MAKKPREAPEQPALPDAPTPPTYGDPPVTILTFVGGSWDNPTPIKAPGSAGRVVALVSEGPAGATFILQPNFGIGDVVEIYSDPNTPHTLRMQILDENGNDVSPQYGQTVGRGYVLRKIDNNSDFNWVRTF